MEYLSFLYTFRFFDFDLILFCKFLNYLFSFVDITKRGGSMLDS